MKQQQHQPSLQEMEEQIRTLMSSVSHLAEVLDRLGQTANASPQQEKHTRGKIKQLKGVLNGLTQTVNATQPRITARQRHSRTQPRADNHHQTSHNNRNQTKQALKGVYWV